MFGELSLYPLWRLVCIRFMLDTEKIVKIKGRRLKFRDVVFMKCLFSLLPRPLVQVNHLGCILLKYFQNTETKCFHNLQLWVAKHHELLFVVGREVKFRVSFPALPDPMKSRSKCCPSLPSPSFYST